MSEYVTKEGDRWDWISYKFYKNPHLYHYIVEANPHLSVEVVQSPVLPAGIKLYIPSIPESEPTEELPPWKR